MPELTDQTFTLLKDGRADQLFADLHLRECHFDNCLLSAPQVNGGRSEVRNVLIERCKFTGCQIGPALLRDVTVADTTASDLSIFWGALFHRVRFTGRVSALKINRNVTALPDPDMQARYDRDRSDFYADADWAIDISQARFTSFGCTGVPARLFRLDPETQGIARSANVPADWNTRFYDTNAWGPWIAQLLASGEADAVLAVPLTKPKAVRERFLADLRELRALGIVDPDPG